MRTSNRLTSFVAAALLAACAASFGSAAYAAGPKTYPSTAAALREGVALYQRGAYKDAIQALEYAAADHSFMAQFTLAQVYADNSGPETDHAKAYMLFQGIADDHYDADPDDEKRAPYVAKSLTALAGYLMVGLPSIGVQPDPDRAADYLHHAALFFGDEDAQFELVKLKLKGEGVPSDIASARHWLAVLTQRGHAGAQAFLADLYWRGKFMEQDKVRAFALIAVALENAPPRDRIWIEDIYQNIFCGAGDGIRKQANGIVAEWRKRYGRKPDEQRGSPLDSLYPLAIRTCQNGDRVAPLNVQDLNHQGPKLQGGMPGNETRPVVETMTTATAPRPMPDSGLGRTETPAAAGLVNGFTSMQGSGLR